MLRMIQVRLLISAVTVLVGAASLILKSAYFSLCLGGPALQRYRPLAGAGAAAVGVSEHVGEQAGGLRKVGPQKISDLKF